MKRLILLLGLHSCSGNNSEIGCWETMSIQSMGMALPADNKEYFCFEEDGKMNIVRHGGDIMREGTYVRREDGATIIVTYTSGLEETFNNVQISGSEMTFDGRDFSVTMERH